MRRLSQNGGPRTGLRALSKSWPPCRPVRFLGGVEACRAVHHSSLHGNAGWARYPAIHLAAAGCAIGRRRRRRIHRAAIGQAAIEPHHRAVPPAEAGYENIRNPAPHKGDGCDAEHRARGQGCPVTTRQGKEGKQGENTAHAGITQGSALTDCQCPKWASASSDSTPGQMRAIHLVPETEGACTCPI